MNMNEIVSDEELTKAFGNANFGSLVPREVIRHAVLKVASGYYQGHTSRTIATELGLITPDYKLTTKGREYLWSSCSSTNF